MTNSNTPRTKKCSKCGVTRSITRFAIRNNRKSGRQSCCLHCHSAVNLAYRIKNGQQVAGPRETFLYEAIGFDGQPLYVGVAFNFERRRKAHIKAAYLWTDYVKEWRVIRSYPTRQAAEKAEARRIRFHAKRNVQLVNITHNPLHTGPDFYVALLEAAAVSKNYFEAQNSLV